MENPFELILEKLNQIEETLESLKADKLKEQQEKSSNVHMNVDEVAEYLGLKKPTIYSKVGNGEIPHSKRSNRLYFFKNEIDHWLSKGKRRTNAEIEHEANEYLSSRRRNILK